MKKATKIPPSSFPVPKLWKPEDNICPTWDVYPVISLSLKSMKQPSRELSLAMLKRAVGEEFSRHWPAVLESGRLTKLPSNVISASGI